MARLPVSVGSYLHEIVTFICPFSLYESHHLCSYPPHTAVLLWQSPSYGCQTHGSHLHMRSSLYGSHLHIVIFTWPPYHHMAVIPSYGRHTSGSHLSVTLMLVWRISPCDCYHHATVILVWPSSSYSCHPGTAAVTFMWQSPSCTWQYLNVAVALIWRLSSCGTVHLLSAAVTLLWP